jgi:hypothetical protein
VQRQEATAGQLSALRQTVRHRAAQTHLSAPRAEPGGTNEGHQGGRCGGLGGWVGGWVGGGGGVV